MLAVTLDFETYYSKKYSLSKLTTEEYITGGEFEVIGFSIKLGNTPTVWYTGTHQELTKILDQFDWPNIVLICHNTFFDASILSFYYGIWAAKYIDTLSMARALHGIAVGGPLAKLAEHYGIGVKGTEVVAAEGKHRKDFTPEELNNYGDYCINDTELTHALCLKLMPHFSMTELSLIDITIKMAVQPILEADYTMLEAHLDEVRQAKQILLDKLAIDKTEIMSNLKFSKMLEDFGVTVPMKTSPTTGKQTLALAKTDEGLTDLLGHEDEKVRTLVEIRLGVKSSIEETRTERFMGITKRIRYLPVPLFYYGAATGRWTAASGQAVNFQNLPRISKIKQAIHAPKGSVIVASDLSNIELRVGLWLADEHDKLKLLGGGLDLYKDFASKAFNVPYNDVDKKQRFIGKTSSLSLIFGVGAAKLQESIRAGIGVDIGEDEAKRIVKLYREEYSNVKAAWQSCGLAITQIDTGKQGVLGYNDLLVVDGKNRIRLPSGLYLKYPQLHQEKGANGYREYQYKLRNGWDKLYPGKLYNNCVQALARCVMGEAMVRIQKRYPIILTIHDAVYIIAPEDEAQAALRFLDEEMCKVPEWMPNIPLAAESHYGYTLASCT